MNVRKINASPDFLNLVVGLTTPDPSKRLTMEQVKSHPWFDGPIASPEELKEYFYSLQHEAKANDAAHYQEMQGKRSAFAQTSLVERGAGDEVVGPDDSEVESWNTL
jgi:serine/threonine protein kinase